MRKTCVKREERGGECWVILAIAFSEGAFGYPRPRKSLNYQTNKKKRIVDGDDNYYKSKRWKPSDSAEKHVSGKGTERFDVNYL